MTEPVILTRRDGTAEFDCIDCGVRVHRFAVTEVRPLCVKCLHLPGWQDDPQLRRILGGGA